MNASFENMFSNIKTSEEHIEINDIVDQQKKEVKTFIHTHIGRSIHERKPTALKRFEKGLQKYFFGVNGVVTRKKPHLLKGYNTQTNKMKYHNSFIGKYISPLITPQSLKSKIKQKIKKNSHNTTSHSYQPVKKTTNKISLQTFNTTYSNKHITHNDITNFSTPRHVDPLYKNYLKNSKSLNTLTKSNIKTNSSTCTINNISTNHTNSVGATISFNKTKPYLRLSLSDKQMKIKQKLITMNNSRRRLERKLFRIADNAHVHNKTLKYLKSNVRKDLESLSDKQFMLRPKEMYNTKAHFRDSQKTIEVINKYSKDLMPYEVNFTLDKNPTLIRLWKTKRKITNNVMFNRNLRQKVEDNHKLIHKWKYNMDILKDELMQHYNEVNISNKKE